MNLQYLKYFSVLAEMEHVTRAAETLFISQPSLTNAMRILEKDLNITLYRKNGRNIALTKEGRLFAEYLRRGFQEIEEGERLIRRNTDPALGHINLGFFPSLGEHFIPELVRSFLAQPGYGQHTFAFGSGSEIKIRQKLKDEDYDLIFCSSVTSDEDLEYFKVAEQPMHIVVSSEHPLAQYETISLKQLEGLPFVCYMQPDGLQTAIRKILSDANVHVNFTHFAEQGSTIAGLVAANFGVSILPDIPTHELHLVKLNAAEDLPPRNIYLARNLKHYLYTPVKKFINFILEQ